MAYRSQTVTVGAGGSATVDGFQGDSLVSLVVAPAAGAAGTVTIRLTRGGTTATLRNLTCTAGVCQVGQWSPALALDDDDVLIIQTGDVGAASVLVGFQRSVAGTFADLVDNVAVHAPGAPDNIILQAIRETWRDFLRRTKAWRKRYFVELDEDTTEYDLADDGGASPHTIREVRLLADSEKTADTDGAEVLPQFYRMAGTHNARTIKLLEMVPGTGTSGIWLRVECIMLLHDNALEPGNHALFAEWRDAVVYGAAANLAGMPGRRWTSRREEARMMGFYLRQVGQACARTAAEGRAGACVVGC